MSTVQIEAALTGAGQVEQAGGGDPNSSRASASVWPSGDQASGRQRTLASDGVTWNARPSMSTHTLAGGPNEPFERSRASVAV